MNAKRGSTWSKEIKITKHAMIDISRSDSFQLV